MSLSNTSNGTSSSIGKRNFFPHPNQLTITTGEGTNRRFESIPITRQSIIPTQYQDVGNDKNLQYDVTNFFYNKVLKWIKKYHDFKHLEKYYNFLKESSGKKYIYDLLRLFVKKSAANWYDLRSPQNYGIIKDFLKHKIGNI